jgi:hypothetical protein
MHVEIARLPFPALDLLSPIRNTRGMNAVDYSRRLGVSEKGCPESLMFHQIISRPFGTEDRTFGFGCRSSPVLKHPAILRCPFRASGAAAVGVVTRLIQIGPVSVVIPPS